jgi:hypothetical protein
LGFIVVEVLFDETDSEDGTDNGCDDCDDDAAADEDTVRP